VLGPLTLPPRLALRALDDLHTLAEGIRRLTDSEADLDDLLIAVRELPLIERKLSERIDALETQVSRLHDWLQPLHAELTDLDDTAEGLQRELTATRETIAAFHLELRELRDRIPGI
jgi:uncharacterized coiled-coil DUF342 family protein